MIFFFIAPLWLLAVISGLFLLPFRRFRWISIYLIIPPTLGMLCAYFASLIGALGGGTLGSVLSKSELSGLFTLGGYGVGLVGGAILGALLGLAASLFLHRRLQRLRLP